jgi:hypothetical protein
MIRPCAQNERRKVHSIAKVSFSNLPGLSNRRTISLTSRLTPGNLVTNETDEMELFCSFGLPDTPQHFIFAFL